MKSLKITQEGIAHYVVPLLIVLGSAIAGAGYIVSSHADSPTTNTSLASSTILSGWTKIGTISPAKLYNVKVPPPTNEQPNMNIYACKISTAPSTITVAFMAHLGHNIPFNISSSWYDSMDLSSSSTQNNVISNKTSTFSLTNNIWDENNKNTNTRFSQSVNFPSINPGVVTNYYIWASGSYQNVIQNTINNHPNVTSLVDCQK